MSPPRKAPPGSRLGSALGLALSLLLHALVLLALRWAGSAPEVDFELTLPSEIELGITETVAVQQEPEVAAAPPEPQPAQAQGPVASRAEQGRRDAGAPQDAAAPDASAVDAGKRDAGETAPADAGKPADAGLPADGGRPVLAAYAPKGAQIALRLHMGRIRESPLAGDVRRLLSVIPDWQQLLEGSGIEPMTQLQRVFIASPNLERSSIVVAGEYRGGVSVPREAVQKLASAAGKSARFRTRAGIAVAPWHNRDATRRVVALIAPGQFVIARPDDLPRILSIARGLATRKNPKDAATPARAGDALLGLPPPQTLALSVEGARNFARGNLRGVPERLEASVEQPREDSLRVRIRGFYEDAAAADEALEYWRSMQRRLASHPLVAFVGLRRPVADANLSVRDDGLHVETAMTAAQARLVLDFMHNALAPRNTPARLPAPPAPAAP